MLTMLHPSKRDVPCCECSALAAWEDDGKFYCTEHRPYVMGERFTDDMGWTPVDPD